MKKQVKRYITAHVKVILMLMLALTSTSLAQLAWFDQLVNTEEHLIHREEVGPYLVSADGQRLIHDPYLRFDIRHQGEPLGADASLRINTILYGNGSQFSKSYEARYEGGRFVTELDLDRAQSWAWDDGGWLRLNLIIEGPAGEASGVTGIQIYPPKLEVGWWFRVLNAALPLGLVALFALIFSLRKVKLQRERPTSNAV